MMMEEEYDKRLHKLKEILKKLNINLNINLDGNGNNNINTEIGFFNHMLTLIGIS